MHTTVFATNNLHKLKEVQAIIGSSHRLLSLSDIGCTDEIPEDYDTLEQNASQKAWYIFNKYQMDCFADDTGLEVDALHGAPGVYSARYAGEHKNSADNMQKLLKSLSGEKNRAAQFRTVIALVINGVEYRFEGVVRGQIIDTPTGTMGFGYDPIFIPDGHRETFASMNLELKNSISHRGLAIQKLSSFLQSLPI